MDYKATIEYLYNQLPMFSVVGAGAYKPGLANARTLDNAFGNQHQKFDTIHVAGTNGKGSTSSMLAAVLQASGYRTGLYTSPHIFDFRERIRVDGEMIEPDAVVDFVQRYLDSDVDCSPSFFELTTIMAFDYFARCNVDVAVIETGLGGRLDTTNIIKPKLCVITNVSLDHTAQLGNTLSQIAYEKAGIMKHGVATVIGEAAGDVKRTFAEHALQVQSPVVWAAERQYDTEGYKCQLTGEFQRANINTVLHAVDELRNIYNISDDSLRYALEHVCDITHLFGRWTEKTVGGVNTIVDTGHNIGAWQYLAPALEQKAQQARLHVVIGFVADKDIEPIFKLLPKNAIYYFVAPNVKRARDVESLLKLANANSLNGKAYKSVSDGYNAAISAAKDGDTVFIGGSNYLVAELQLQ